MKGTSVAFLSVLCANGVREGRGKKERERELEREREEYAHTDYPCAT